MFEQVIRYNLVRNSLRFS